MKIIGGLLVSLCIAFVKINAQSYNSSFVLESNFLQTKTISEKVDYVPEGTSVRPVLSSIEKNKIFLGWGFFYCGKINLDSDYQFEFRPGIIGGQEFYNAFQLGLFLRYKFLDDYFGSIGITTELHKPPNNKYVQHTFTIGLTLDRSITDDLNLVLSVYKPLSNYFGYSFDSELQVNSDVYLYWIIKLGVELNM